MVVGFHLNTKIKLGKLDYIILKPTFSCCHTRVKNVTKVVFSCIFKFDKKNLKVIVIDNLLNRR